MILIFFRSVYWPSCFFALLLAGSISQSYNPVNNIPLPSHTHTHKEKNMYLMYLKYHSRWSFVATVNRFPFFFQWWFWGPPNTPAMQVQTFPLEGPRIHTGGKKKPLRFPDNLTPNQLPLRSKGCFETKGIFAHLFSTFAMLVDFQIQRKGVLTLPETNELHLKMDGWNMIGSFWESLFSGSNC